MPALSVAQICGIFGPVDELVILVGDLGVVHIEEQAAIGGLTNIAPLGNAHLHEVFRPGTPKSFGAIFKRN